MRLTRVLPAVTASVALVAVVACGDDDQDDGAVPLTGNPPTTTTAPEADGTAPNPAEQIEDPQATGDDTTAVLEGESQEEAPPGEEPADTGS